MKRLSLLCTVVAAGLGLASQISVAGSDTMLLLNERWAEAFQKDGPSVAVTSGGSSLGFEALIGGTAQIAASSRPINKAESDFARSRGATMRAIPVALDGLAVVVNATNSVQSLTLDQLRGIYTGKITNWRDVGGPNLAIVPISRNELSGTHDFFFATVLGGENWGRGVRFLGSTAEELREIGRVPGAIGYGGVAYFRGQERTRILGIARRAGTPAVLPDEQSVRSRQYPIWRNLYFYTVGTPRGEVKAFVDFVLSPKGQRIAEEVGYFSLKPIQN